MSACRMPKANTCCCSTATPSSPANTLKVLVDRMEGEPDLGILGCRILNWNSRRIDQWVYAQPYETHGNRPFDTYSFSAAGALVRASVIKDIGGFWERLFIYNEEVDLAVRVIRHGFPRRLRAGRSCPAPPQQQRPGEQRELFLLPGPQLDLDFLPPLPVLRPLEKDRHVLGDVSD